MHLKWGGGGMYFWKLVGPHASTPCMNHWETCKASGEIKWDLELTQGPQGILRSTLGFQRRAEQVHSCSRGKRLAQSHSDRTRWNTSRSPGLGGRGLWL